MNTELNLELNKIYSASELMKLDKEFVNKRKSNYFVYRDGKKIYLFKKIKDGYILFDIVSQIIAY